MRGFPKTLVRTMMTMASSVKFTLVNARSRYDGIAVLLWSVKPVSHVNADAVDAQWMEKVLPS